MGDPRSTYLFLPVWVCLVKTQIFSSSAGLCSNYSLFVCFFFFFSAPEVAEELGRTASSSSIVPYLPRLPILPSKTRTLKKQAENKENIEGTQDTVEHSASSSAPGRGTGTVAVRPRVLEEACCWCKLPEKQRKREHRDTGRCSALLGIRAVCHLGIPIIY